MLQNSGSPGTQTPNLPRSSEGISQSALAPSENSNNATSDASSSTPQSAARQNQQRIEEHRRLFSRQSVNFHVHEMMFIQLTISLSYWTRLLMSTTFMQKHDSISIPLHYTMI